MKSFAQMQEHEPSDLIPLHDGMVISFINYELRVNLEKKDAGELKEAEAELERDRIAKAAAFQETVKGEAAKAIEEAPVEEKKEEQQPAEEVVEVPEVN